MTTLTEREKKEALRNLAAKISSRRNWWLYPIEPKVEGFLGAGSIFIVGDQPSTAPWEYEHPHRRAFYDLLATEGAGDCHLTDVYKRRGRSGELRDGLPRDFMDHLEIFRMEVRLLNPTTILALGWDAYRLLLKHMPELEDRFMRVWHFGTVRHGQLEQFRKRLRHGIAVAKRRDRRR